MADQAGAWTACLFYGELDPEVVALVAVVEQRDRPGDGRPLGIVGRVIVEPIVGQLLHEARSYPCKPGRWTRNGYASCGASSRAIHSARRSPVAGAIRIPVR